MDYFSQSAAFSLNRAEWTLLRKDFNSSVGLLWYLQLFHFLSLNFHKRDVKIICGHGDRKNKGCKYTRAQHLH